MDYITVICVHDWYLSEADLEIANVCTFVIAVRKSRGKLLQLPQEQFLTRLSLSLKLNVLSRQVGEALSDVYRRLCLFSKCIFLQS